VFVCGILRVNRGGPKSFELDAKSMKQGVCIIKTRGEVSCFLLCDKRPVVMISTIHDDYTIPTTSKTKKEKIMKQDHLTGVQKKLTSQNALQITVKTWVV
jgi:hypothetical protein